MARRIEEVYLCVARDADGRETVMWSGTTDGHVRPLIALSHGQLDRMIDAAEGIAERDHVELAVLQFSHRVEPLAELHAEIT